MSYSLNQVDNVSSTIVEHIDYDVLSPDGIPIERDKKYKNPEELKTAFLAWLDRYRQQGYYSRPFERIPLCDLQNRCTFIKHTRLKIFKSEIIELDL